MKKGKVFTRNQSIKRGYTLAAKFIHDRISVIMPCYNSEPFLRESIGCVLEQTYPNVELIVVDDGSSDKSKEILSEYGNRIVLMEQEHGGPYTARNKGVGNATGEFIAFLDADDYWTLDCLQKLHAKLVGSNAVLAYCGWQNVGIEEKSGAPYIPPDYEAGNKAEMFLCEASPWPIHAALVRREILDLIGGFDLDFPTCMDYDLWLRIGILNPIVRVEEAMAFYRHHNSEQITSTEWRQARNVRDVKKKFVKTYPEWVGGFSPAKRRKLIDGAFLKRGFRAYWRRDLVSAQRIFRAAFLARSWKLNDLRYILPAMFLPEALYIKFVGAMDNRNSQMKPHTK